MKTTRGYVAICHNCEWTYRPSARTLASKHNPPGSMTQRRAREHAQNAGHTTEAWHITKYEPETRQR